MNLQLIPIEKLKENAVIPEYATTGSAGLDLCACLDSDHLIIEPGERKLIPTGIKISLPEGYFADVRPRSGLALKHGLTVLNTPGTIDSDYRGEIGVILINHSLVNALIENGMRIAQLVIQKYERIRWYETKITDQTQRRDGGFGSTGK